MLWEDSFPCNGFKYFLNFIFYFLFFLGRSLWLPVGILIRIQLEFKSNAARLSNEKIIECKLFCLELCIEINNRGFLSQDVFQKVIFKK